MIIVSMCLLGLFFLKRLHVSNGNAQIPLLLFTDFHVRAPLIVRLVDGNRINLVAGNLKELYLAILSFFCMFAGEPF